MCDWKKHVEEHLPRERFRGDMESDIRDEIAAHLEDVYRAALARGVGRPEAEALARAEIDDWEALAATILCTREGAADSVAAQRLEETEASLRARGGLFSALADISQEFRFAGRRLRKAPGFSAVVLLTLSIGIGATTAIFSVVKGVLLDPLPFDEPDRLVAVWNSAPGMGEDLFPQNLAFNAANEDEARSFENIGVWVPTNASVMGTEGPEEMPVLAVTQGVLPALRVEPILGRTFTREDIRVEAPRTILRAYRYWETRFDSDPGAIGQTLQISGAQWEIIGVMPEGFRFLDRDPDLYMPFQHDRATLMVSNFVYQSLGRLADGVTMEQAVADLARILPMAMESYPGAMTMAQLAEIGGVPHLNPLKDDVVGSVGQILWVVLAGVGIILLVACANVANLILVRAEARDRAVAMQAALGSSRMRLAGQFLTESVALSVLSGAAGVVLAHWGLVYLKASGPTNLPRLHEIGLDFEAILFAVGIALVAGLLLSLLPLARTRGMDMVMALKEGGRGLSAGRERGRARDVLVVAQLGLALVLLVGSGLMMRSFVSLSSARPGFSDAEELLTFRVTVGSNEVPSDENVAMAHDMLGRELAQIPGVTAVGSSSSTPMDGRGGFDPVFVEDFPLPEGQTPQIRRFKWIGGDYHEALGNPIVAGRGITWADIHERARVVMITESIAREYWGDPTRAVGRRLSTGYGPGDWREIIGVVGDVRDDGMEQGAVDIVYWPMVLEGFWAEIEGDDALMVMRTLGYVVRSPRVGTPGFIEELRDVVWASYPNRPLGSILTMDEVQRDSMARTSFTLVMLGIAAAVALLLGGIGIYGVIAYTVGQRTREMGLRVAMGASPGDVIGMVMRKGLLLAAVGVGVGIVGALATTRLMEAVLFGVSPADPLTFGSVSVILVVVALLASYVPARRAAQVDPMVALRAD